MEKFSPATWINQKIFYNKLSDDCYIRHFGDNYIFYRNADGLRHRLDGPAQVSAQGSYYKSSWYILDKHYHSWADVKEHTNLSDEEMTLIILKYGLIS